MKHTEFEGRGQALIIVALLSIAIFAIVGLAVDGSAQFADRRHAQNVYVRAAWSCI